MEFTLDSESEEHLAHLLNIFLKTHEVEGPAAGICRQIIGKGFNTLTPRQLWRFNQDVKPLINQNCEFCEDWIPWEYRYDAYLADGHCHSCYHKFTWRD